MKPSLRNDNIVVLSHATGDFSGQDGGGGDGMEPRIAKLEAGMGYIEKRMDNIHGELKEIRSDIREVRANARTDFRTLLFFVISGFAGILAAMAKGFGWLG